MLLNYISYKNSVRFELCPISALMIRLADDCEGSIGVRKELENIGSYTLNITIEMEKALLL